MGTCNFTAYNVGIVAIARVQYIYVGHAKHPEIHYKIIFQYHEIALFQHMSRVEVSIGPNYCRTPGGVGAGNLNTSRLAECLVTSSAPSLMCRVVEVYRLAKLLQYGC